MCRKWFFLSSVYVFTSSEAWRLEYICMCYECLPMCLCVATMHCVCGQVCRVYAMSTLAMDMFCVYVCVCMYLSVRGLACSGHRLNCFHMCLNSECWVGKGNMSVCLGGVSGFIAPSTAFGPPNTKLKFPRLPAHTLTPHSPCGHNAWKHGKTQLMTDTMYSE